MGDDSEARGYVGTMSKRGSSQGALVPGLGLGVFQTGDVFARAWEEGLRERIILAAGVGEPIGTLVAWI